MQFIQFFEIPIYVVITDKVTLIQMHPITHGSLERLEMTSLWADDTL